MSAKPVQTQVGDPVEHDAVSFSGIRWFVVVLVGTLLFCQLFVWGLFEWTESRVARSGAARAVLADPPSQPVIEDGRLVSGSEASPSPALLVSEPTVLREFQARHHDAQTTYGWINQGAAIVRLPIERAKDLVLERGLPIRPASSPTPAPADGQ